MEQMSELRFAIVTMLTIGKFSPMPTMTVSSAFKVYLSFDLGSQELEVIGHCPPPLNLCK